MSERMLPDVSNDLIGSASCPEGVESSRQSCSGPSDLDRLAQALAMFIEEWVRGTEIETLRPYMRR